jgi:hypothetical protein
MKGLRFSLLFAFFAVLVLRSAPVLAIGGDRVIPQVADGLEVRTQIAVYNLSGATTVGSYWLKLSFFRANGTPWVLSTSIGTASEFSITLLPRQTFIIKTLGYSNPMTAGYARLDNRETQTSIISTDYAYGVNAFYEISTAAGVVDTVSVPVYQLTSFGTFPVEIDSTIDTGFAIVNPSPGTVQMQMDLYDNTGRLLQGASFPIDAGVHRSEFLDQYIFPGVHLNGNRGLVEFKATAAVAILVLRQYQTSNGVQYATLEVTDKESLSRTSFVTLNAYVGGYIPVDLDTGTAVMDYHCGGAGSGGNYCAGYATGYNGVAGEDASWDFVLQASDATHMSFLPYNGTMVKIGYKYNSLEFDTISLCDLKNLTYSKDQIDLSNGSDAYRDGFTFAIRTGKGNYAKLRFYHVAPGTFYCMVTVYR